MRHTHAFAVLVGAALPTGVASAGGQFVSDTGTQSFQRSGAFVAKADDPSALFFNPAGLARMKRKELQLGANIVSLSLEFDRFGGYADGQPFPTVKNAGGPKPIPYLGFAMPISKKLGLGVGLYTPHGYGGRDLPDNDENPMGAPQRYDAVKSSSVVVLPSVGIGYRVNDRLSIGLRATWGVFSTETKKYVQGLPNEAEDPGNDSATEVKSQDLFVPSAGLGIHYEASESVQFGFVFNSPMPIRAEGTIKTTLGPNLQAALGGGSALMPVPDEMARCAPGGTPDAIKVCTDIDLPMNAAVGVRLVARDNKGREMGDLEFDLRWENWAGASDYNVVADSLNTLTGQPVEPTQVRHGLKDVFSARLGSSGRFDVASRILEVRAGVGFESAAAPNSWTRLDVDGNERFMATGGIGLEFSRFRLDAGLGLVHSPTRQVRDVPITDPDNRVQPDIDAPLAGTPVNPFNAGEYRTSYLIGSFGVVTWW